MSSAPSTAASNPHTPAAQAAARQGAQGARKPAGPENGSDLFSNLLLLLSATSDVAPVDGWTPELSGDAAAPAAADGETPLDAMLAWAQLPGSTAGTESAVRGSAADPRMAAPSSPVLSGAAGTQELLPATPAGGHPAQELQGLQVLNQPEALDAQTQARLSAASGETGLPSEGGTTAQAAPAHSAAPAAGTAGGRPGAWRSTTQMGGTHALQQWHHTQTQIQTAPTADRLAVRVDASPALSLRSTVALDQRFAQAGGEDSPGLSPAAPSPLAGPVAAASTDTSAHGGTGGEAGADGGNPSDATDAVRTEETAETYEEALAEAEARAEERFDRFTSAQLRQASLRVGEDGQDAIDVQLSLNGQELHLNFRTDSAEARAELRQSAEGSLSELLQRGGLQLGDVNVSAQNGQAGRDAEAGARAPAGPGSRARSDAATAPDAAPAPAALRPRTDGSRPLDLFV